MYYTECCRPSKLRSFVDCRTQLKKLGRLSNSIQKRFFRPSNQRKNVLSSFTLIQAEITETAENFCYNHGKSEVYVQHENHVPPSEAPADVCAARSAAPARTPWLHPGSLAPPRVLLSTASRLCPGRRQSTAPVSSTTARRRARVARRCARRLGATAASRSCASRSARTCSWRSRPSEGLPALWPFERSSTLVG